MARQFSLAYLTLPGIAPLEQIRIAGEAGYDCVSLRTIPMGQPNEPQTVLEADPALFRAIRQQMESCGLFLPPIPPSIRVFSSESTLCMRWPKYWSFSFSIILISRC